VFSGRGFCNELITRPEEFYRMWRVVVCSLETSEIRRPWTALDPIATEKKKGTFKNPILTSQGRQYVFITKTSQFNVV
jgi:hypothetical protein